MKILKFATASVYGGSKIKPAQIKRNFSLLPSIEIPTFKAGKGKVKEINLAILGHGTVGGTLIDQILASAETIEKRKEIKLNIFAVANSRKILLDPKGVGWNWRERIEKEGSRNGISDLIEFTRKQKLKNRIAIDNTASTEITAEYAALIENGFDLVSSNKKANSADFDFYQKLREVLIKHEREYLYEANVGAGLPLIDTIGLLHLSGENITRIRGVFSGSLSYIFNHFSVRRENFSKILNEAVEAGLTEPDPREDLSGNDVGRKLLILARELDLENEFEEIKIENLVPDFMAGLTKDEFLAQSGQADVYFENLKGSTKPGNVLKYVGELSGDLSRSKGILETGLVEVSRNSPLGQLGGADSLFEIYTESYGERPIIIQGAGAGAEVTARGVFGDILRLASRG